MPACVPTENKDLAKEDDDHAIWDLLARHRSDRGLVYVIISGLANPRTRPFVIGLGILAGLGFGFVATFFAIPRDGPAQVASPDPVATSRVAAQASEAPSAPSPPKSSATESKRPKMALLIALGQAVDRAWKARALPPTAEAPTRSTGCPGR